MHNTAAVETVTIDAFATAAQADHREHLIVDSLGTLGNLIISLDEQYEPWAPTYLKSAEFKLSRVGLDFVG